MAESRSCLGVREETQAQREHHAAMELVWPLPAGFEFLQGCRTSCIDQAAVVDLGVGNRSPLTMLAGPEAKAEGRGVPRRPTVL